MLKRRYSAGCIAWSLVDDAGRLRRLAHRVADVEALDAQPRRGRRRASSPSTSASARVRACCDPSSDSTARQREPARWPRPARASGGAAPAAARTLHRSPDCADHRRVSSSASRSRIDDQHRRRRQVVVVLRDERLEHLPAAVGVARPAVHREVRPVAEVPAAAHHRQVDADAARRSITTAITSASTSPPVSIACWCSTRDSAASRSRTAAASSNRRSLGRACILASSSASTSSVPAAQEAHRAVDVGA
jgi:hypothetical protein